MVKFWKKAVLFYLGGCLYLALELLWRRFTDGSMFLAGGLCFLLIGAMDEKYPQLPWGLRALAGSAVITLVELGFGLTVNRDYHVWDYRGQPGAFLGQICPLFSLLWVPVGLAAGALYRTLSGILPDADQPLRA